MDDGAVLFNPVARADMGKPAGLGRRITQGGEIRVKVDPERPCKIRVDQGLIYAVVTNEKKKFDWDDTVREAYLTEKQGMGYAVDPKKELKISMTGDSQVRVKWLCHLNDPSVTTKPRSNK